LLLYSAINFEKIKLVI